MLQIGLECCTCRGTLRYQSGLRITLVGMGLGEQQVTVIVIEIIILITPRFVFVTLEQISEEYAKVWLPSTYLSL